MRRAMQKRWRSVRRARRPCRHGSCIAMARSTCGKCCPIQRNPRGTCWRRMPRGGCAGRSTIAPRPKPVPQTERRLGCPHDCGLCPDHSQHTCIGLLEVTGKCDLACPVCYADAGSGDLLSLAQVEAILDAFQEAEGGQGADPAGERRRADHAPRGYSTFFASRVRSAYATSC